MDYISDELGGVIPAALYGRPRGEQTILTAAATPAPRPTATPVPTAAPTPIPTPTPAPSVTTYVVVAGDSLWRISQKLYGTGTKWRDIWQANRDTVKNPDFIYIGQVLTIR